MCVLCYISTAYYNLTDNNMELFFVIMALIALCILIVFLVGKLVRHLLNLSAIISNKNTTDVSLRSHGVVYNETTDKLEADQSLILPF